VTVSSFDATFTAARCVLATLVVSACRPGGLPPEPAGEDAADAGAPSTKYQPGPNPYETSAFEGVPLDGKSGHEGMNHGKKPMEGHEGMDMPASEPTAKDPHEGMDMPAKEKGQ
jgi:hypothetical protein